MRGRVVDRLRLGFAPGQRRRIRMLVRGRYGHLNETFHLVEDMPLLYAAERKSRSRFSGSIFRIRTGAESIHLARS